MVKNSIVSIFFFLSTLLLAQEKSRFLHLEHRLSNHTHHMVPSAQDTLGHLWISNVYGINKFDGYGFSHIPYKTIFGSESMTDEIEELILTPSGSILVSSYEGLLALKNRDDSFHSLSTENGPAEKYPIIRMFSGPKLVWLVSSSGELLSYDTETQQLTSHVKIPDFVPKKNTVTSITRSRSGILFFITNSGRLFAYDALKGNLEQIEIDTKDSYIHYADLTMDLKDRLWVCTSSRELGPLVYDPIHKNFVQNELLSPEVLEGAKATLYKIFCDSNGVIWIASDGDGLYRIDIDANTLKNYRYDIHDQNSINGNIVLDLFEDRQQNLWVFTEYGEINILPKRNTKASVRKHRGTVNGSQIRIQSIIKSKDGSLWMGTDGQGLVRVSPDGVAKEQFLVNENFSEGFLIRSILEDDTGIIWVATVNDGIWHFDPESKKIERFPISDAQGKEGHISLFLFKDEKNRIWVSMNWGIAVYDANHRLLTRFVNGTFKNRDYCRAIIQTGDGDLWFGQRSGLYRLNEHTSDLSLSTFTRVPFFDESKVGPANMEIHTMATDGVSKLWMTTTRYRLYAFDYKTDSYFSFDHLVGNERPVFKSVEVQDTSNIWVGSNQGLWHLNTTSGKHEKFYQSDGFLDNRFLLSSYKDSDGHLYFGSINGINFFNPKTLSKSESKAKLFINEIEILNERAKTIIPDQVSQGVTKVDELVLEREQSSFSFEFQAINDLIMPNYSYSYKLKGFDDTWLMANISRKATYTNIPSGDYEFVVRAGTEPGVWNVGEKSIRIHIEKPFYYQPWALALYGLSCLFISYAGFRWVKMRNSLVQEKMDHQKDTEVYNLKMDFFAKISHEIQTPLTLMLLPLDEMLENSIIKGNAALKGHFHRISYNAKRLSRIVFDLTNIRNKELKKLKIALSKNDLVSDLKKIMASFEPWAEREAISFHLETASEKIEFWYDRDKIEHIFYNLLSNALKFTPNGGSIGLELAEDKTSESIVITVRDTGPGMTQKELGHIFELFYQTSKGNKEGMGIGLALAQEFVDLHGGNIKVESKEGLGTCFTVNLPLAEPARESQFTILQNTKETTHKVALEQPTIEKALSPISGNPDWTVLIVEDDITQRDFIEIELKNHYDVIVADNGEQGYALAKEHLPKLILSDVMMPKLNGIELAKKLQKNKLTAHIPIILMTADSSDLTKISALQIGVIEHLFKPFNMSELLLKLHNIINQTDRVRQKTKIDLLEKPSPTDIKSKDDILIEKLTTIIEKNMANPEFKVESLASELHMSYSTLIKKFQTATGLTLVDFVRSMRIKRAAQFLKEGNYSVAEAAYEVGFNDVKYFSKCFRRFYGENPSSYKKIESVS